ncbi:MAG: serine O-acetyltransferase [Acidimicrobiales bacterium]
MRAALRQDVAGQLERTPSRFAFFTSLLFYRGLQATAIYRIARWCAAHHLRPMAEVLVRVNQLVFTVDIAHQAEIGHGLVLRHPTDIVIGRGSKIGRNVTIFNGVTLGARFSGSANRPDGSPVVADDVFIGTGAKLLGPVEVGPGAVIGANAVVTRSVPAGSTVVGNPARAIGNDRGPGSSVGDDRAALAAELAQLRRRVEEMDERLGALVDLDNPALPD